MADTSYLDWPFFESRHRILAQELDAWAGRNLPGLVDEHDVDTSCRRIVEALGSAGWLVYAAPDVDGPVPQAFDLRSICLIRETLARHAAIADFAFAMQGLGTASIVLFGTREQRARWTPGIRDGRRLSGFVLSEPEAGSDVGAMSTTATRVSGGYSLSGTKTWISNGGIADQYVVFARDADAERSFTAFVVDAQTPGLRVEERLDIVAPHPMATLAFEDCVIPEDARLGEQGAGMRIALATLDVFRPSVGAAANGLARRALEEAAARATSRRMFGGTLADLQLTQAKLADIATDVDAAALLVYRAAWAKDCADRSGATRITREAAMAKLFATEAAQRAIDAAVQIWGAAGVRRGSKVEELYREIRAMRIYEGATEVQKVVIARQLLAAPA